MTTVQISLVKQYMEGLISFLEPLLPLANCHMVEFFTSSAYKNFVRIDLRNEIESYGLQNTITNIYSNTFRDLPILKTYIENTKRFTVKNCPEICMNAPTFRKKLESLTPREVPSLRLNRFMTSKKSHEVEILCSIAVALSYIGNTTHIVDIGDGKGYLSSLLAYHHTLKVLGIDASEVNTVGADKRAKKLSKAWKGLVTKISDNEIAINKSFKFDLYKQVTHFIDDKIDLIEMVNNVFLEKATNLSLVGLHTCGNLGPTSLKIFSNDESVKTICNVSCCYHLLTESFEINKNVSGTEYGFPLSRYLTEKKLTIGRKARMTGAQSVDRIMDKKELPSISIFYRAVLQVILEEHCEILPVKHVGKIKKCQNFLDYTRQALKILGCDLNLSDEEINAYDRKYYVYINELYVFYLIRCLLSPVVESIVLIDRLLYLLEKGFKQTFLVQLFDPVISPRCYGLISVKDDKT